MRNWPDICAADVEAPVPSGSWCSLGLRRAGVAQLVEQRFRNLALCPRHRSLHWTQCRQHRPLANRNDNHTVNITSTAPGKKMRRAYLGDGATVAAAGGAFCVVEVLLPIFFDRLRTFAAFLRWMAGLTTVIVLPLSVVVSSYGVGRLRGSGPPPVMTPALPLPMPLPAVLPVVPEPVICPFASPKMKGPTQTPTKMICRSLDKFIVFRLSRARLTRQRPSPAFLYRT